MSFGFKCFAFQSLPTCGQYTEDKEYEAKRAEYDQKLVRIRKERDAALKANEAKREADIQEKRKVANAKVEVLQQEQAAGSSSDWSIWSIFIGPFSLVHSLVHS